MDEENDLIGKQIGNYRLIEEIAAGSFGTVYRAQHHILTNRIVALKVLHKHMPVRERERFIQESRFLEGLQHRHILSVVDIGFDNGRPYLASTYAHGGSLRQLLNKKRLLPWDQVDIILTQVGEALHYAHQQKLVHCDLKPENILFNAQGEALLADFGIATVLSTVSVKQIADPEGTPSYMAPEQFRGQVSKETDQYALGCIAYELLAGQRPFSAPDFISMGYKHATEPPTPPRQINAQIPAHVEQAILKALAKQRNDRHHDVAAFLHAVHTNIPSSVSSSSTDGNLKISEFVSHTSKKKHFSAKKAMDLLRTKLLSAINLREALQTLKRIVVQNARHKTLRSPQITKREWFNKGLALYHLKRYEEALSAFEQALRVDPNYAKAYNNKGLALNDLKRSEEALVAYEQALRVDPNYAYAYNNKGLALNDLKRYEEALSACEQALRLDPNYAYAYNGKGIALYNLKRYEEALSAYEQALRLDPNYTLAYYNKSLTLDRLGRTVEAQQARKKAR